MKIRADCPSCRNVVGIPRAYLGIKLTCVSCGCQFRVVRKGVTVPSRVRRGSPSNAVDAPWARGTHMNSARCGTTLGSLQDDSGREIYCPRFATMILTDCPSCGNHDSASPSYVDVRLICASCGGTCRLEMEGWFMADDWVQLLKALGNPRYKWRSIDGIATETVLTQAQVAQMIRKLPDQVIRASERSTTGRELFTTRDHYKEGATIWRRLLRAVKNRAD